MQGDLELKFNQLGKLVLERHVLAPFDHASDSIRLTYYVMGDLEIFQL